MPKGKDDSASNSHNHASLDGIGPDHARGNHPHDGFAADRNWNFTFSSDLQSVTSASVIEGTSSHPIDITGAQFTTVIGTNDLGQRDVVSVSQIRTDDSGVHAHLFGDQDGDNAWSLLLDVKVATTAAQADETHKLTFDSSGKVTGDEAAKGDHPSHGEPVTSNETYETVTLGGKTYVVQTEAHGDRYDFWVARDDNGDGTWSVIAEGHVDASLVGTANHAIDVNAIQSYLASASAVIG